MFDSPTLKQMLKIGLMNSSLKCAFFCHWSMKEPGWEGQLSTSWLSVSEVKQRKSHSRNVLRQNLRYSLGSVARERTKEGKPEYYLSKKSKCIKNFEISIVAMTVLFILLTLSEILCLKYLRCMFWRPLLHTAVSMHWQPTEVHFYWSCFRAYGMCISYSSKLLYREGCYSINKHSLKEIRLSNDDSLSKVFFGILVYA